MMVLICYIFTEQRFEAVNDHQRAIPVLLRVDTQGQKELDKT